MRRPLDRLRLDPTERHVNFNFHKPRRDKSEQFQLVELSNNSVVPRRRLFNADKTRHPPFNVVIVCVWAIRCDPIQLSPMYSAQHTVVHMPSENSAPLDNGPVWNAEHLKLDNSPNLEAAVATQSASLDAHLQLGEQLSFGEPLRYDAEFSSDTHASHDALLLYNAQPAEQQQTATREASTFILRRRVLPPRHLLLGLRRMNYLTPRMSLSVGDLLALQEIPVRRCAQRLRDSTPLGTLSFCERKGKCSIIKSHNICVITLTLHTSIN